MHGGGVEAVDQAYARALAAAGGSVAAYEASLAMRRRQVHDWLRDPPYDAKKPGRPLPPVRSAIEAAARAESIAYANAYDEAVDVRETLARRRREAPAGSTAGYRPGSQAQRHAAGNRPPPWNEKPPWGRSQRW